MTEYVPNRYNVWRTSREIVTWSPLALKYIRQDSMAYEISQIVEDMFRDASFLRYFDDISQSGDFDETMRNINDYDTFEWYGEFSNNFGRQYHALRTLNAQNKRNDKPRKNKDIGLFDDNISKILAVLYGHNDLYEIEHIIVHGTKIDDSFKELYTQVGDIVADMLSIEVIYYHYSNKKYKL